MHPALTINGQVYKGDLQGYDIFRAICSTYSEFKPYECLEEFDIQKELGHAKEDFRRPDTGRTRLVLIVVAVAVINFALVYLYRMWNETSTETKVREEV